MQIFRKENGWRIDGKIDLARLRSSGLENRIGYVSVNEKAFHVFGRAYEPSGFGLLVVPYEFDRIEDKDESALGFKVGAHIQFGDGGLDHFDFAEFEFDLRRYWQ